MSQAIPSSSAPSPASPSWTSRLKFRHILFLLLLLTGIVPLILSSSYLLDSNQEILKDKEKQLLTLSAEGFAQQLSDTLAQHERQLLQLGRGLVAAPERGTLVQRLKAEWASQYLSRFATDQGGELLALQVVDQNGQGLRSNTEGFGETVGQAMADARADALERRAASYRFALLDTDAEQQQPAVVMAVPVEVPESEEVLILQALVPLRLLSKSAAAQAGLELEELFLIDPDGNLLWSAEALEGVGQALLESDLVHGFGPVSVTREIELEVDGEVLPTLAQVVPVRQTGWGVVAHRMTRVAFHEVRDLVFRIVLLSALAVGLAFVLALLAARWFSQPIQKLAEASHEIAAGHFHQRVSTAGLSHEVANLASDFNRMSETVESYIARLQRAAEANRQLFISSIRAFAAAIDAKDPYTRGHSERVASYSRAIAHHLGLPKEMQEKVWISAVLHDVGKIGVDDRVLKKGGVLTAEEFDEMKLHPVIGADIVEPISALRDMLPGIRWHHEAWNGDGYPDGLRKEQIPLMARIIGVADTFDAITTSRPYQEASPPEHALTIIKKLTGKRFDAKIVTAFLLAWEGGHIQLSEEVLAASRRSKSGPPVEPRPSGPPGAPQPGAPQPGAPQPQPAATPPAAPPIRKVVNS